MLVSCKKSNDRHIFENMPYSVNFLPKTAILKNGEHHEPYFHVYLEDQIAYGDFNNDGRRDAAVIISVNGEGSGTFYRLAFLINDGKKYVNKQTYSLGDRVVIHYLRVRGNKVIADMRVHGERDCQSCPTKHVKNEYYYTLLQ